MDIENWAESDTMPVGSMPNNGKRFLPGIEEQ